MKFGDSLRQRSVPEWSRYNFDYASVKQAIKDNTTPGNGKAISIPGQSDSVADSFEDALYRELINQHERVGMFVKMKGQEIIARLDTVEKQLESLKSPSSQRKLQENRPSVRRKLADIDLQIISVGECIQDLSRFVAANRLAIHKLLKKYRKWTGSTTLSFRMKDILNKPSSFTQTSFVELVNRYTSYLEEIRSPNSNKHSTESLVSPIRSSPHSTNSFPFEDLSMAFAGSGVEFDAALEMAPGGKKSKVTKFWVHKDNVVELRILLLQRLGYAGVSHDERPVSPTKQREMLARIGKSDEVGFAVLDSQSHFAKVCRAIGRSVSAQKSIERYGTTVTRWTTNGDMAAVLPEHPPRIIKLHRTQLGEIVTAARPLSGYSDDIAPISNEQRKLRDHLNAVEHLEVLAFACSNRSRFVGLANSEESAEWAALDEDVRIGKCKLSDLRSLGDIRDYADKHDYFPHAILTVRTEGDSEYLLDALKKSHLIREVEGFCLGIHAVSSCRRLPGMNEPAWMSALNTDIRVIPTRNHSRKGSEQSTRINSSGSGTSRYPSQTETTTSDPSQPYRPPKAQHERRRSRKAPPQLQTITTSPPLAAEQTQQGYWNEYDNPEDEDNDAFYVYIDPNAPVFPGQETLSKIGRKFLQLFKRGKQGEPAKDVEQALPRLDTSRTPLLLPHYELTTPNDGSGLDSPTSEESSSEEDNRNYGTAESRLPLFATLKSSTGKRRPASYPVTTNHRASIHDPLMQPLSKPNEQTPAQRLRLTLMALAASLIILVIAAGLSSTAKHKYQERVDVFAVISVAASISFALLGLAHMFTWSYSTHLSRNDELRAGLGLQVLRENDHWVSMPRTVVGSWTAASVSVGALVLIGVDIWLLVRTIA